jgi:putative ABC transport system substrate-binding protein
MTLRRREFITLAGGAAASVWPLAARAQQGDRVRRIGMLIAGAPNNRGSDASVAAFRDGLTKLGWIEGRNLRVDLRFGGDEPERIRASAVELVALAPDVMVTSGVSTTRAVQEQTQTIPIVTASGGDPVASGLIHNIARPEGNITGFSSAEPSIASKWLELLKEAAPRVTRVAIIFIPELAPTAPAYISLIEAAAPRLGVDAIKAPFRTAVDVVRAIDAFAAEPNGGLLVLPPPNAVAFLQSIVQLAEQHRLPAIYPAQADAAAGGLMAYATDLVDQYRRAASYVDRILRGTKVGELPVQFPTKYELVINLKTAKAIGLSIPESFLLLADRVIE